ncbi:MAG: GyrI-like protein [Sphingobacteriales bacterium]|nr:GyrI-like protein [Sphingobacteriales bacterium]
MKLSVKILIVCFVLSISCSYVFIPNSIKISKKVLVKSSNETIFRFLQNPDFRKKWWPGKENSTARSSSENIYKNTRFDIGKGYLDFLPIKVISDSVELTTNISLASINNDSTEIHWEASFKASLNPIKRVLQYRNATTLHSNFGDILHVFKNFIEDDKKVYGLAIQFSKVTNPVLLTTKFSSHSYPTTNLIYNSIDRLKASIKNKGVVQIDSPMLNIFKNGTNEFEIQTAIPVNKSFEVAGNQAIKRMVLGRILVTEVMGGQAKVETAFIELENYLKDKHLLSPAIPYQLLITNRTAIRDSNNWITRIYYPIY